MDLKNIIITFPINVPLKRNSFEKKNYKSMYRVTRQRKERHVITFGVE